VAILCAEAKAQNYLVKNKRGEDYIIETAGFPAYLIDLTNPQAFLWFKAVIRRNLIDAGLSGWMADYGEWLPADAQLYSGENALSYHNQYAVDWARLKPRSD
jgi:alpha-glucosidase